jgi:hypothetical protein
LNTKPWQKCGKGVAGLPRKGAAQQTVEIMEIMDWCYELDGLVGFQNPNGDAFSETECIAGRVSVPVFDCQKGHLSS